jgi:hypothetical protein
MGFLFTSDSGAKKGGKKKGSSFQTVSALFRVKYKSKLENLLIFYKLL